MTKGLNINYWDCKYSSYHEGDSDGEYDDRLYLCSNKNTCGACLLDNKYFDDKAYCEFAEIED